MERGLQEELGLETKAYEVLAESQYHYEHGSFYLLALRTEIIGGEIELNVHDAVEWVSINELMQYKLTPVDIPIAEKLKKTFQLMSFNPNIVSGDVLEGTRLTEIFKCSSQGGMRRSHRIDSLVLVSDYVKSIYLGLRNPSILFHSLLITSYGWNEPSFPYPVD